MRHFAVPFILSILLLTACDPIYTQKTPEADRTASNLHSRAAAGDGNAQLEAGFAACETRAGVYDSDPSTALRWWKKAAAHPDTRVSFEAHLQLGEYYLAEYVYNSYYLKDGEPTRPPGKYKKIAKCRGEKPVKPDYNRAEFHFRKCANGDARTGFTNLPATMCRHGLGNLYYLKKDYAESLFWYLSVTAMLHLSKEYDIKKWLDGVKDYRGLLPPMKGGRDRDYAEFAARKLSPRERAAVVAGVKAYLLHNLQ